MTDSQALEQRTPQQQLVARIRGDEFKQQVALALPGNVPPERFVRATVTALMQNPDIIEATSESIFQSVIRCAQDGLIPDGREAALVIFNAKVGNGWEKRAQYMPMIGGFRKIAAEHGWSIRTQVVHSNDEFEYELGLEPRVVHRPAPLREPRGDLVGAYAVATHRDGRREVEVLTAQEIAKVRATSRAKDSGPWRDWTERMWEKTAGRRLFAKLPLGERDPELIARVLEASKPMEPGDAAALLYGDGAREVFNDREPVPGRAALPAAPPVPEADRQQAGDTTPPVSSVPDGDEFDGEEPPAPPAAVTENTPLNVVFSSGRYSGKSIVDVYSEGKDGISYLRWALKNWNAEPIKSALTAFAETHPEIAK
jgi:phage RecT family recombinase